jgi:hypothetical protein
MINEEYDMLFWRDGDRWQRDYAVFNCHELDFAIYQLRIRYGPVAIMLLHHSPGESLHATSYSDEGLKLHLEAKTMKPAEWLTKFIQVLPKENYANLKKHCEEKVGIFNPTLYTDRELS